MEKPKFRNKTEDLISGKNEELTSQFFFNAQELAGGREQGSTEELSRRVPRIVITGGPACGKTTVIEHLRKSNPEYTIVEEAATRVLSSGLFSLPSDEQPWTQEWQNALQRAIANEQLELERKSTERLRDPSQVAIVQDRGLADAATYLSGGLAELEELTGHTPKDIMRRYDRVIHLGWVGRDEYLRRVGSNPVRFELPERAQELARISLEIWSEHPNFTTITSIDGRKEEVVELVQKDIGL